MTVVAAAVIGSAIVGGVVSHSAAKKGAKAAERGATTAAEATMESTRMQIEEIARQFDYQQRILLPQIQQQYNAQRAYSDLLGIGGPAVGANAETGFMPTARSDEVQQQRRDEEIGIYRDAMRGMDPNTPEYRQYEDAIADVMNRPTDQQQLDASAQARGPQMGGPGTSGMDARRDPVTGAFVDPNLDPRRLADDSAFAEQVATDRLAGEDIGADPYNQYLRDNAIAAGSPEESIMVQRTNQARIAEGAAGTGVYGDVFQESPGYAFQVEEMGRELDRKRSAGGPNIGGRAIMEAQRRAQGLANQDYYNWAAGRERDLGRLGAAEAQDIQRGDQAYAGYENQRIADVSRQDQGYQNFLARQAQDTQRGDVAATQQDTLRAADQQRQDQSYYNYLNMLAAQAGFGGGPAAQAVDASQAAGAQTAAAYGSQGSQLSNIYQNQGVSQANAIYAGAAGVNNALQSGVSNWITYKGAQPPGPVTPPSG